jgi:hypothetical protein
VNFNPHFPVSFYSAPVLKRLVQFEGYSTFDSRNNNEYELLQVAYLTNTFYPGKHYQISNIMTPIFLDKISTLDNQLIVSYGCKNDKLIAFRYMELARYFETNKNFTNPTSIHEKFSVISIKKLKNICSLRTAYDTIDSVYEKTYLRRVIIETEIYQSTNMEKVIDLRNRYFESSPFQKEKIIQALKSFLDLGMYMRGWSGVGAYPLQTAPVHDQDQINIKVTLEFDKFEQLCNNLNEETIKIGDQIMQLPLLQYSDGEFSVSTDSFNGLTIRDRLELVKKGDDRNTPISSCIRLSSNWICASAYRYLEILGSPPFNIEHLSRIS